jgi:hypothetical protein
MYRSNVESTNHVCTTARELEVDALGAKEEGLSVEDYRLGKDLPIRQEEMRKKKEASGGGSSQTT